MKKDIDIYAMHMQCFQPHCKDIRDWDVNQMILHYHAIHTSIYIISYSESRVVRILCHALPLLYLTILCQMGLTQIPICHETLSIACYVALQVGFSSIQTSLAT